MGLRKKRYRPHGVRNVVSSWDSCDNAICQYHWVASRVEKYLDSGFMLETASLGVFIGCIGRRTNVLSFVRSTQRRTPPLDFGTTTRGWHHLVGESLNGLTMPCLVIRSRLSFTSSRHANGMERVVDIANVSTFSFR